MALTIEEIRAQVEQLVSALNARDFDAIAATPLFDPEASEFNSVISASEGETYRGIDGLREWARNIDETWDGFHIELQRLEPAGERRVVVEYRATGTAKASGVPLDIHTGQVWTFDDDWVLIRNDSFSDPRDAFEAAGVPYGPSTRSR